MKADKTQLKLDFIPLGVRQYVKTPCSEKNQIRVEVRVSYMGMSGDILRECEAKVGWRSKAAAELLLSCAPPLADQGNNNEAPPDLHSTERSRA